MSEKIGDRYITLAGDRPYTPLRKAFFQAADFKAGLMAAGLSFAYEGQKNADLSIPVVAATATLMANMLIVGVLRVFEKYLLYSEFKNSADLCIDTQPDHNTLPTTPDHMKAASQARLYLAGWGLIGVITDGYRIATGSPIIHRGLASFSEYTRLYQGYNRFNKVLKGEWAIVDMPPREKVLEKKGSESPAQGVSQPAPSLNS